MSPSEQAEGNNNEKISLRLTLMYEQLKILLRQPSKAAFTRDFGTVLYGMVPSVPV